MANSLAVLIATHDKLNIFTSTAADMCKRHILYVAVEKYEIRFRPEKKHTLIRALQRASEINNINSVKEQKKKNVIT